MWLDDLLLIPTAHIKSKKKLAAYENNRRFMMEFMQKLEIAMRRYRITNIPDTCNERVILQSMICMAGVVFYKDPEFGDNVFALTGIPSGKGFNINGDPVSAYVYSKNGLINKEVDLFIKGADNTPIMKKGLNSGLVANKPRGVFIWENRMRYPFMFTVEYFAKAIADTYRTIDVAKVWMKHPFLPVCEESMVNSVKEVLGKIEANEECIPISTGVKEVTKIDFHDIIGSGETVKDAMELLDWYEQKYREKCGLHANTQADKKGENLLTAEINMNDDFTEQLSEDMIEYINEQLDFANEVLGTDMHCELIEKEDEDDQSERIDDGDDVPGSAG